MKKTWGDHCSSDDEEDHSERVGSIGNYDESLLDEAPNHGAMTGSDLYEKYEDDGRQGDGGSQRLHDEDRSGDDSRPPRKHNFPTEPPYTAYVGNLAYTITDAQTFGESMIEVVREKLGLDITIVEAKIIRDRNTNRPRGFGYIEVETLDILKSLMELNTLDATIAGRRLLLDTVNKNNTNNNAKRNNHRQGDNDGNGERRRNGGYGDIDGTNFRGGRYSNRNHDHNKNNSSSADQTNELTGASPVPLSERPKLVLKPRSIPLEELKPLPSPKERIPDSATTSTTQVAEKDDNKQEDNASNVQEGESLRSSTSGGHTRHSTNNNVERKGGGSYKERNARNDNERSGSDDWRARRSDTQRSSGRSANNDQPRRSFGGRGRSEGHPASEDRRPLTGRGGVTSSGRFAIQGGRSGRGESSSGRSFQFGRNSNNNSSGRSGGRGSTTTTPTPSANTTTTNKTEQTTSSDESKSKKTYTPPVERNPSKPEVVQKNSFAALGYDSDSD